MQQHIKVGKDVLESLTTSMYEDHRSIYREYVQNSCDQIDKAIKLNILKSKNDGEIHIRIDLDNREIEIYDNATGIKQSEVYEILSNVALSNKDRENERGFRGIGRLAGLGYCEELIFETSYFQENIKSIMSWNAKKFKEIINDRNYKQEASEVIKNIINKQVDSEEPNKHYFKVILKNVTNDELLNIQNIKEYLSMVAPIPLRSHFVFKNKIQMELEKDNLIIDEYHIYVNEEQLYKAYKTDLKDKNNNIVDKVHDVSFIKLYDKDEKIICWGWYGVSDFEGAITKNNIFRKIRLRKGNIQIGLENTLNKLHKEDRGNSYFIGEIHAFHSNLIPNARRDYFSENEMYKIFETKLKEVFINKLYKLYYQASSVRSETKRIENYHKIQEEFENKSKEGLFENQEEIRHYEKEINKKKSEAFKARDKLDRMLNDADSDISNIVQRAKSTIVEPRETIKTEDIVDIKPIYRTQKRFPKLNKKDQKLISKIYAIIDNVLAEDLAEDLKLKIEEEFK